MTREDFHGKANGTGKTGNHPLFGGGETPAGQIPLFALKDKQSMVVVEKGQIVKVSKEKMGWSAAKY